LVVQDVRRPGWCGGRAARCLGQVEGCGVVGCLGRVEGAAVS
jgi:hypothetical protein